MKTTSPVLFLAALMLAVLSAPRISAAETKKLQLCLNSKNQFVAKAHCRAGTRFDIDSLLALQSAPEPELRIADSEKETSIPTCIVDPFLMICSFPPFVTPNVGCDPGYFVVQVLCIAVETGGTTQSFGGILPNGNGSCGFSNYSTSDPRTGEFFTRVICAKTPDA